MSKRNPTRFDVKTKENYGVIPIIVNEFGEIVNSSMDGNYFFGTKKEAIKFAEIRANETLHICYMLVNIQGIYQHITSRDITTYRKNKNRQIDTEIVPKYEVLRKRQRKYGV